MFENDTKVVHCQKEPYDVYIGRPSKWGNPFSHLNGTVESREDAIRKYSEWIVKQDHLMRDLPELKGMTLGCWCKPKPCHGDVLVNLVEKG